MVLMRVLFNCPINVNFGVITNIHTNEMYLKMIVHVKDC
jgi:hypothetical protein